MGGRRGGRDRYDDRRGGYGGNWRRGGGDYRYGRYDSYDRRDYGGRDYRDYGRRDYRDDYPSGPSGGGGYRGGDRYASGGREDRYGRDERRDYRRDRGYYDRDANPPSYGHGAPRDPYPVRFYEPREDWYAGR